ncbi:MAG: VCBS repeat-containing protein [Mesorhizobium sp.]|uniref:Ig-like domain-containing protein n=1 Tax=Mesorhizobium sp. TaxID=1871066 RepID=UPI000FEA3FAD|nr:Ig-like domain-containing protein [Mesorhizobium sp.]RWG19730.1 MAG: VCBS repeat-containing protein [Mesorhizobium sp.]
MADAYLDDPEFAGQGQWAGWSLLQFDANGDGQVDYRLGLMQSGYGFQLYETAPGSLVFQTNPPDTPSQPQVTVGLAHDTGASASDGITNSPTLTGTGDANAVVSFTLNGNPTGWTTTADANGVWSFRPSSLADGSYMIEASETNAGGTGSASLTFTLDGTRPVVTGFATVEGSPTNASAVHYILTFPEPVAGVDAGQFNLAANGLPGAAIKGVEPVSGSDGTQYVVTVDSGSGDGTVALSLDPGAGIQDFAGNGLAGGPASFSAATSYATGLSPLWGAIGDVNGDGNADLVLPNRFGTVGVYLGAGDGTLGTPAIYSSVPAVGLAEFGSFRAYLADVNGDGSGYRHCELLGRDDIRSVE